MKKLFKFFTSSKFILSVAFLINVAIFLVVILLLGYYYYISISFISLFISLFVLARSKDDPSYKITWLLIIAILPIFGSTLHIYLKSTKSSRKLRKTWQDITKNNSGYLKQNKKTLKEIKNHSLEQFNHANYLLKTSHSPVHKNSGVKYIGDGAEYFKEIEKEIENAKVFVYLQFFIIKKGVIWDRFVNLLKQKAALGVEVLIMYDYFGCLDRFSRKHLKMLKEAGIKTTAFNKIKPTINRFINYRDHRKIVIIDNKVAFTGGINIGDEYANLKSRFGHWKDCGVKVTGEAVWDFLVLFSNNWQITTKEKLYIRRFKKLTSKVNSDGFVQVFGTGPVDEEPIARNNYIQMINGAKKSVHIVSPYLIIDLLMTSTLQMCAKRGIDVKILLPGIPDKKTVFKLGYSYYEELINAGVKIYQYRPGFVHSKAVIIDEEIACVGTINFDFRSLYLHFEDAVMLYGCKANLELKKDIENSIKKSELITLQHLQIRRWYERVFVNILKLFAPLM